MKWILRYGGSRDDTLIEHVDLPVGLLHGELLFNFIGKLTCVRWWTHHNLAAPWL